MIRIGIYGYGNLGRGVENAIRQNPDMTLVAVFTRRDPASLKISTPTATVASASDVEAYVGKIDVMIICGGSATDLPEQTPAMAKLFNVVDSFDTHAKIPQHVAAVQAVAEKQPSVTLSPSSTTLKVFPPTTTEPSFLTVGSVEPSHVPNALRLPSVRAFESLCPTSPMQST